MFAEIYPPWLIESKLGYLIWGLGGSVGGFLIGFLSGDQMKTKLPDSEIEIKRNTDENSI